MFAHRVAVGFLCLVAKVKSVGFNCFCVTINHSSLNTNKQLNDFRLLSHVGRSNCRSGDGIIGLCRACNGFSKNKYVSDLL